MAPLNGLTFVGIGEYPLDTIWSPGDERYGECTQHMIASGDWTVGGQPTNRGGTVNYNDDLAGGASGLGVNEDKGDGGPIATYSSWDFTFDVVIAAWPTGPNQVIFLTAAGRPDPPYAPGTGNTISLGLTRGGFFFQQGQSASHTESTGVTFHGGTIGVHLEVTPKGLWWVQASAGGALAYTACGEVWGGGELFAASWGCGSVAGGPAPAAVLVSDAVAGTAGTRDGPAECPHPPVAGRARTRVLWLPWGE